MPVLSFIQDKHPPLYYLLLHGWTRLFGGGDVSVRLLGVLIGALAVLPTYGIGRRLGGDRAGAIAALLLALNPFLIWYSQEARMFMPATTFLLVGLYGILHLAYPDPGGRHPTCLEIPLAATPLRPARRFHPPGYRQADPEATFWLPPATLSALLVILGFTAALYSYLFSAFMLPVAGLWVLLLAWQGRNTPGNARRTLGGAGQPGCGGVLFLPLARNAWSVSGAESVPGRAFAGAAQALVPLLATYAVGWPRWIGSLGAALAAAAALLALAGMLAPDRWLLASGSNTRDGQATADRHSTASPGIRRGGLFLAIWLAVPLLLGGLLLARDRTLFDEFALLYLSGAGALPGVGTRPGGRLGMASRRRLGRAGRGADRDVGRAARQLVAGTPSRGLARDSSHLSRRMPAPTTPCCSIRTTYASPSSATLMAHSHCSPRSPRRSPIPRRSMARCKACHPSTRRGWWSHTTSCWTPPTSCPAGLPHATR